MKKQLTTLDAHNAARQATHCALSNPVPQRNGIACPSCENELFDSDPYLTLTSDPPRKHIHCACGYRGTRIA